MKEKIGMSKQENSYSYINKEIDFDQQDYIGFKAQKDALDNAIDSGAKMIGLTADYGYGKSSLVSILSKDNKKYAQTIKINMWDGLQKRDEEDQESKEIRLEKSFLFQLANNSGNRALAKHVNKRLSGNSGLLSFTFRSSKMWIWLIFALLFFTIGLVCYATTIEVPYSDLFVWENINIILKIAIYPIFYCISIIFLIIGLKKYNAAFSSWKSEGQRKFDSSDVFSIFQEIIESIKSQKTKIILIEDLDRIEEDKKGGWSIEDFIKILYRLSNSCIKSNICFIVAIKPGKAVKIKEAYGKFFDYILDLKAVHIDDFTVILESLLREKQQEIKDMFALKESHENLDSEFCGQFSYLIHGNKLTIRELKHRLNDAIVLFKTIQSKKYNSASGKPNMITCCAISYLKHEYEDYYKLVENERQFEKVIEKGCLIRIDTALGREEKINKLIEEINNIFTGNNKLSEYFVREISGLMIDGIIDDNYREYFFSYPNGSYIKNIYEHELEEVLLFGKKCDERKLEQLIDGSFSTDSECKVVKDCMTRLMQLNKTFPTIMLLNERLLSFCYSNQKEQIIRTMVENYSWENDDTDEVVRTLSKINSYTFSQKTEILKEYSVELYNTLSGFHANAIKCRVELVKKFHRDIIVFKNMFIEDKAPCLSGIEAKNLEDVDLIFELLVGTKCTDDLLLALADIVKSKLNAAQLQILTQMIKHYIVSYTPSLEALRAIASLITVNKIIDDNIFKCISTHSEELEDVIEQYLNALEVPVNNSYCECIRKFKIGIKLNDNILRSLYDNKFYITYLKHCVALDKFFENMYDSTIFNKDRIADVWRNNQDLFAKYRLNLLHLSDEVKEVYSFIFESPYPILSVEEAQVISIEDSILLHVLTRLSQDKEKFVEYLQLMIHSGHDAYVLMNYLLDQQPTVVKDILQHIPFAKVEYSRINEVEREEIAQKYVNHFNTMNDIVCFAESTSELLPSIENIIIEKINADMKEDKRKESIEVYIKLLDKLNIITQATIDVIIKYKYLGAMPLQITQELRKQEKYLYYIVGRTLYDKKLTFDTDIPLDEYINVYVEIDKMFEFMSSCLEFLKAVYTARKFDRLTIEQLLLYNTWGQRIELLKAFMSKCSDINLRKTYLRNMERIDSLEDSDRIYSYLCSDEFDDLLIDDEIANHVKKLLWNEHFWLKGSLQHHIKKLAG